MQDDTLIKQAQAGNAQAFEALLEHYYDLLYRFAYKWCGNREDAEDVAQQACIKLANSIQQFRFESSFSTWLYRLVINCAKDWQKSQARHQTDNESSLDIHADLNIHEQPEKTVLIAQLLNRLESFSEGMKETVLLVHAEGFTHGEAATILGVKESTVSWRIHEIRKQLQSLFGQGE
ncbi:MAG: RNA polymerase sigma factor [Cellvibrionaceae bacterium]